jgi:hypothetical protein
MPSPLRLPAHSLPTLVAVVLLVGGWPGPAAGKARASIAVAVLDGADAVVLVARAPGRPAAFEVTRSYLGPLAVGARVPIENPRYFERGAAGGRLPDRFVLVLRREPDPASPLGGGWVVDTMASKPIAAGWAYVSLDFPGPTPTTADDLGEVERLIQRGLAWREDLRQARAESQPAQKLARLRSLFVLPAPDFDGHYDLIHAMYRALREAERAGPAAREWLRGLMALPYFQDGYGIAGWTNFGPMGRKILEEALARVSDVR